MNKKRGKQKLTELRQHREQVYLQSLDNLIQGIDSPDYVHYRFKKYKRIK